MLTDNLQKVAILTQFGLNVVEIKKTETDWKVIWVKAPPQYFKVKQLFFNKNKQIDPFYNIEFN